MGVPRLDPEIVIVGNRDLFWLFKQGDQSLANYLIDEGDI